MVENDGPRRLTRRTSNLGTDRLSGSPENAMSFGESHGPSSYSKRMNDESLQAMAEGESEEDGDLVAVPFKIVMLGDASVGKTCIVQRYIYNQYSIQQNTLSANFASKILVVKPNGHQVKTKVKMQIWDTAGSEQYRSINQLYYKKAAVVCLVYSTTDMESFDALDYWVKELNTHTCQNSIKYLIGAKVDDAENDEVSTATAKEYAKKIGARLFLTSSKENLGINKLFNEAAIACATNPNLSNEAQKGVQDERGHSIKLRRRDSVNSNASSTYESFAPPPKRDKKSCKC